MKVVNTLQLGGWLTTDGKFSLFLWPFGRNIMLDVEVSH